MEEPESATVVGIPVTELRGLFPSLAVKQLPTPLSSAPSPAASRASPSEPALPASGRNLVASPPAPELEQDAEPPRVALEPIGRPLAEFPGPAPAREVAVQPPAEPVSVVSSAPVSEVPTPAPKAGAAAKSETATAVRAQAEPAPAGAPGGTALSGWEARIHQHPDNPQLRFRYSELLLSAGDYRRAVEVLEKAQRRFPSVARVCWHLAHAYWHQGLHKRDGRRRRSMEKRAYLRTLAAFETFLRLAPDDSRAPEARVRLRLLKKAQKGRR